MVLAVNYGLGCAAFLILIALALLNRRPRGIGILAIGLFALTALWAFTAAGQAWWMPGLAHLLEGVRGWAWLQFLTAILLLADKTGRPSTQLYRVLIPALGLAVVANDLRFVSSTASPIDFDTSQVFARIVVAIVAILLVENLYRNAVPSRRWHILPLCLAAGSMFAYDLFIFSQAFVTRSVDVSVLSARGIVLVLVVPLLILTMARNEDWRVDIHVSRRVVFHTATLTAGGFFLLITAGAASLLGSAVTGEWGSVLKIAFFCGSALVLATVISTEGLRSRARRLISENFFSHRYDYREEWMRFVQTLSAVDHLDPLQTRVIRAITNIVDSPGGLLWVEERGVYRVANSYGVTLDGSPIERADGAFIAAFNGGEVVQDLRSPLARSPQWAIGTSLWLAVPLLQTGEMLGFIVLAPPRSPFVLDAESLGLLRMAGRQVASYLAEERATKALVDAKALIDYSTKFAFIVHDVKNLSSQLGMMVTNAKRYGENSEFRADMIRTLENSVGRLNGLLSKLRADGAGEKQREIVEVGSLIKTVVGEFVHDDVAVEAKIPDGEANAKADAQELRSVLRHLVTNAIEASDAGKTVKVSMSRSNDRVIIEVEDEGCGMAPAFIHNELFTPRRSTKANGHGIGAFQAREIVCANGGDLEVISVVGRGTIMRIMMPSLAAHAQTLVRA